VGAPRRRGLGRTNMSSGVNMDALPPPPPARGAAPRAALSDIQQNRRPPPELPVHAAGGAKGAQAGAGRGHGALQHAHKDAIERLVARVVDVGISPAQRESLQCYVYRLLGSRLGAPSGGDEFQLVEKMKRSLAASSTEGAHRALRFAEVYRRFSQKRVVANRWGIMHLLNALSNSGGGGGAPAGRGAGSTLSLLEQSDVFKSVPPPMPDLASELEQSLAQLGPAGARPQAGAAGWRDHEAVRTDHQVPEAALVRDVVFAMQGIDGQFVKFDKSVDGFAVERGHGVPAPTRDLVRRICESGWLYRKVTGAVRNMTEGRRSHGMVVQGLAAGLQAELNEYYRLVAVLQAQSAGDVRDLGDRLSKQQSVGHRPAAAAHDTAPQPLTLRRLLVWVQEPIARLKVLALLCDAAMGYGRPTTAADSLAPPHAASSQSMLKGGQLVGFRCCRAPRHPAARRGHRASCRRRCSLRPQTPGRAVRCLLTGGRRMLWRADCVCVSGCVGVR